MKLHYHYNRQFLLLNYELKHKVKVTYVIIASIPLTIFNIMKHSTNEPCSDEAYLSVVCSFFFFIGKVQGNTTLSFPCLDLKHIP